MIFFVGAVPTRRQPKIEANRKMQTIPPVGSTLLDRYAVEEIIDAAGDTAILRCIDTRLDVQDAVKFLIGNESDSTWPERRQRFIQSFRAAARLNHPNIVHVANIETRCGMAFSVMELLQGPALSAFLGEGAYFEPKETIELFLSVIDAVAMAHSVNTLHKRISPSQIILNCRGTRLSPRMLNFMSFKNTRDLSIETAIPFLAPEQYKNFDNATQASDIFSLCATMYYVFTHEPPLKLGSIEEFSAFYEQCSGIDWFPASVPAEFVPILSAGLRTRPEERRWTALTLLTEIKKIGANFKLSANLSIDASRGNLASQASLTPISGIIYHSGKTGAQPVQRTGQTSAVPNSQPVCRAGTGSNPQPVIHAGTGSNPQPVIHAGTGSNPQPVIHAGTGSNPQPVIHAGTGSNPQPVIHAGTGSNPQPVIHAGTGSNPQPVIHAGTGSNPQPVIHAGTGSNPQPVIHAGTGSNPQPVIHAGTGSNPQPVIHAGTGSNPQPGQTAAALQGAPDEVLNAAANASDAGLRDCAASASEVPAAPDQECALPGELAAVYKIHHIIRKRDRGFIACVSTKSDDNELYCLKCFYPKNDIECAVFNEGVRRSDLLAQKTPYVRQIFRAYPDECAFLADNIEVQTLPDSIARTGPYASAVVAQIGVLLAGAMETAHQSGFINGNLKPSNIVFENRGGIMTPVIYDFGQSLYAESIAQIPPCDVPCIAPELGYNLQHSNAQSDIFAFGMCLIYMLLGHMPYDETRDNSASSEDVAKAIARYSGIPDVLAAHPEIAPDLYQVIAWCTAFDPAARYVHFCDVMRDLRVVYQRLSALPQPHAGG